MPTAPLRHMQIRTAVADSRVKDPTVKYRLNLAGSSLGGSFGKGVRSFGATNHQGWDLYAELWTPVMAIGSGLVADVGTTPVYGQQVLLRLSDSDASKYSRLFAPQGLFAFYAHLNLIVVKKLQKVTEGEVIAYSGNSGNAHDWPPHLHFEIRTNPSNALGLGGKIDPGEVLGYQYYSCSVADRV